MQNSANRTAIIVAIIGLVGTLSAAVIANWDKIFAPRPSSTQTTPAVGTAVLDIDQSSRDAPQTALQGVWADSNEPRNRTTFTQAGNAFQFSRRGVLPNGVAFESTGSAELNGMQVNAHYSAQYASGMFSQGRCMGAIANGGLQMELICTDSILGTFPVLSRRQ